MSEMVEKVARAMLAAKICEVCEISDYFGDLTPGDAIDLGVTLSEKDANGKPRFHWYSDIRSDEYEDAYKAILRPLARAAIEAMMEPSEAQLDAAIAPYRHGNTEQFNSIMRDTVRGYWQAMLSAALNPPTPSKETTE